MEKSLLEEVLLRPEIVSQTAACIGKFEERGFVFSVSYDGSVKVGKASQGSHDIEEAIARGALTRDEIAILTKLRKEKGDKGVFTDTFWNGFFKVTAAMQSVRREYYIAEFGLNSLKESRLIVDTQWYQPLVEPYFETTQSSAHKAMRTYVRNLPSPSHIGTYSNWVDWIEKKSVKLPPLVIIEGKQDGNDLYLIASNVRSTDVKAGRLMNRALREGAKENASLARTDLFKLIKPCYGWLNLQDRSCQFYSDAAHQ